MVRRNNSCKIECIVCGNKAIYVSSDGILKFCKPHAIKCSEFLGSDFLGGVITLIQLSGDLGRIKSENEVRNIKTSEKTYGFQCSCMSCTYCLNEEQKRLDRLNARVTQSVKLSRPVGVGQVTIKMDERLFEQVEEYCESTGIDDVDDFIARVIIGHMEQVD